ncbi:MAG: hypothetical protein VX294_04660 [Candidatus Latescibacterota bacterium]|nr:hypothetical protein [Candidatus Latescibacterota bacterium]
MMRLISIEAREGMETVVVNPDNICSIYQDKGIVNIRMTCGWNLLTKFTDVDHATDYIQRAVSHTLGEEQ